MKAIIICLSIAVISVSQIAQAQVKVDVKKKVNREANQRANSNTDKAIDKAFDKVEDGVGNLFKKKDKETSSEKTEEVKTETKTKVEKNTAKQTGTRPDEPVQQEQPQTQPAPQLTWNKYDFVPGTEIIFEDNQEGEQNGEFPSKWDLKSGTVENAGFGNENVIYFRETGNDNGIVPLMKNPSADYLPEEFTVEFDAYFEKGKYSSYYLYFYDKKNKTQKRFSNYLTFYVNEASFRPNNATSKEYNSAKPGNVDKENSYWRHIAISFNKRALKVYFDDQRLLNIPNVTEDPAGITIGTNHSTPDKNQFIKNIRIAKGAVPLYDKFLTDGKFVTTGIKFDVNKATIKPESMGTINYVVKMMTDHPELKFSVEGHTDSDGNDTLNQKLSEARAKAVMEKMTELGIPADRLASKGHGESKPMTGNDTPEGKAQNRRVEFVKF